METPRADVERAGGVRVGVGVATGRVPLVLALGVAGYLLLGLLGRATSIPGETLSLVWPAAGAAVLVLGLLPRGWWPAGVALLAVATFGFNALTGLEPLRALLFVVPNVVQAVVGALLLHRAVPTLLLSGGRAPMVLVRDFVAVATVCLLSSLAAVVSGTLLLLAASGQQGQLLAAVLWWGRNSAGALVVLTLAALLLEPLLVDRQPSRVPAAPARRLELAALVIATIALYVLVFDLYAGLPLAFPLLVPTVWAGLRFSPRAVGLHSLAVGVVVVVATLTGSGPFAGADTWAGRALVSQLFIGALFGLGILLAMGATERRALHQGLAAARDSAAHQAALLSTVIDSMHEGLAVVDEQGRVLLQNPAGERLLQHALRSRPGDHPQPVLHAAGGLPLDHDQLPFVRALRGEEVRDDEVRIPASGRVGEQVLAVSARRLPFPSPEGVPQAVVISHDVTTQRAQRSALESFARVVAHDLRGPLSAVEGWTEVLLQQAREAPEVDSTEVIGALGRVAGAAAGMGCLIRDLLESSTARDQQLRLTEVDLHAVAVAVVAGHLDRAGADRARVHVAALPRVCADEALVRQLLDNLVGNAVKYVVPGAPAEVTVSGRVAGDMVEVEVADRGIGIPARDREEVFGAFQRAEGTGGFEGYGIGLSVCRTIVERHGGSIVARGRDDGPGTTIGFTLPAVG